jgi:imidazolonepropionase-like amidohydrolase
MTNLITTRIRTRRAGLGYAARATAAAFLIALAGASGAAAQEVVPAPPQDRPIALTGGTIHTVTNGVVLNGTIVFVDGRITAVGADVQIPADAERIDIAGRHVYPGLIDAFSTVGLAEIGSVDVTNDVSELGDINPNVRAEVAVNPESRHIGTTRSNGVLVTLTSPSGGLISGLAAAMMLDGWTWEEMTLEPAAALIVNWPSSGSNGYGDDIDELREVFATARAYRDLRAGGDTATLDTDPRWEAMVPVFDGDTPVIVDANSPTEIQDAVSWAEQEGLRIVLRGGADAWYVADHLARKQVPVMLDTVIGGPNRSWEPIDAAYGQPRRLHEAGVRFAITGSSSAPYANRLPYEAGAAIAYGLPPDEALKAVTLYPAQFLGIDDRVGSLEPGRDATLLITTGNPLEYATIIEQAYIQGRRIDMMDAHKRFFEKYREKQRQRSGGAAAAGGGGR